MKYIINKACLVLSVAVLLNSCTDIDQSPMSNLSPESYFKTQAQLEYYANDLYSNFSTHDNWSYGTFGNDNNTDNMSNKSYDNKYVPGEWKVAQKDGDWDFSFIYKCNYFFENAQPKLEAGEISGSMDKIKHYFGEIYFFRAHEYFNKLQTLGDFPIVTKPLKNDMDELIAASKRSPRTEVVHFILSDLDKAINELLLDKPDSKRVRISRKAALLFKSRVALYEATWLKYFKNTAFVPNGPDWPGASKDYNKNYQFPKGSIDLEIAFLLTEAMNAAKEVADDTPLVENNGILQQTESDPENKYLKMFGDVDLTSYPEILLWREYSRALNIVHNVPIGAQVGTYMVGLTRGYVDNFLMANGLPIYANNSQYAGDEEIADVRKNRDGRLWLFLKEPGQKNVIFNKQIAVRGNETEDYPNVISGDREQGYSTGYTLRKGGVFDGTQLSDNGLCYTGSIVYRGVEAYLNYIEACYEKNGNLDGTAMQYWKLIRSRANVDPDINKTIAATDMSQEIKNDWGAYSANKIIDPTLYNIRRERRSELMAEGLRMMDLKRWRSLDQLITTPYHIEGFKLWGAMQEQYKDKDGKSLLKYGSSGANVSDPAHSIYMRPQEINSNSLILKNGGCKWAIAHYLNPIANQHFLITGGVDNSPIYQNPYWPTTANEGPLK